MHTFRPITYNDDDFRAYKYTGPTSVREGAFCKIAASTTRNTVCCTLSKTTAFATMLLPLGTGTTAAFISPGQYFPMFLDDPDIENVAATIAQNTYVTGMLLRPGSEFEIHKSAMVKSHTTLGSITTIGSYIVLGTAGKLGVGSKHNCAYKTSPIIGVCTGTYNNAWVRVRCI